MGKVCLGTAQLGMDYGINNIRGKIAPEEAFKILNYAAEAGIDTLDTAYDYGESEKVIGRFMRSSGKRFDLISKLPKCDRDSINEIIGESLNRLGADCLYGYLIHDFSSFSEDLTVWEELKALKTAGKIRKIGFSVYFPGEIDLVLKNGIVPDLIQFPYNILDQRFSALLPRLKELGIEIHVRSVFLQGLLLSNPDFLSGQFLTVLPKIEKLAYLAKQAEQSILSLLLNFACANKYVDRVVAGVDSLSHLVEIVKSQNSSNITLAVMEQLYALKEDNENIILPFRWQKVMA